MNKFKAASILKNTLEKNPDFLIEEEKEAIEEGILLLYKTQQMCMMKWLCVV